MTVSYKRQQVGEVEVFYREAGSRTAPVLLLLHGFPSSSHMFRELIPLLADRYRVIAPDLPGFGYTTAPGRGKFDYTFDNLATVIEGFTEALGLEHYALYVFDYGAPTGFRLALAHPERVSAIISQNGNAYLDGFSDEWGPWEAYWRDPNPETREACRASLSPEVIENWQYRTGADPKRLGPDGYMLDIALMRRADAEEIQLDLILDYRTNLERYPDFQNYFRTYQPPSWPSGVVMIQRSSRQGQKPISVISLTRMCTSSIPATSPWKPMRLRLPTSSAAFSKNILRNFAPSSSRVASLAMKVPLALIASVTGRATAI